MSLEIERKFLLKKIPYKELSEAECLYIQQGYYQYNNHSIRLRKTGDRTSSVYTVTIKKGHGLIREETEEIITQEEFEKLWPQTLGKRIRKFRHIFDLKDKNIHLSIDIFIDLKLSLLEIETSNKEKELTIPEWLNDYIDKEVTDDNTFTNEKLANEINTWNIAK